MGKSVKADAPLRPLPVDLADVERAARRLAPFLSPTPFIASPWLSEATGADVYLKLEHVQTTGSFKTRGAANALLARRERDPILAAVVTASAGNHGMALAWAGRQFGISVRVHLPVKAPAAKRQALIRLGATLIDALTYDDAEIGARNDALTTGTPYISPYNDADVIAGAGTVALEMLHAQPALDVIIVPLGGGGLLAGIAVVSAAGSRLVTVIGAEVEASPVFSTSLARGAITRVEVRDTIADGLAGNLDPGSMTFGLIQRLVDRVVVIPEASMIGAMRDLAMHERLIVEGSSAVGVAAAREERESLRGRRVGVVLTGRNVDWAVVKRVLD